MRKYSEALRKLYKVNLFKEKKDNLDTMVKAAEVFYTLSIHSLTNS